jgi:hypothetical protein
MGSLQVKNSGTWKEVGAVHFKNGGTWVPVKKAYVKSGGTWIEIWANQEETTFALPGGGIGTYSYIGSTPDAAGFNGRSRDQIGVSNWHNSSFTPYSRGLAVYESSLPTTLLGRTIDRLQIRIQIWSGIHGGFLGNGTPNYVTVWGSTQTSYPSDLNPSVVKYLGTIAFYGSAPDTSAGYEVISASEMGTNPPVNGDRYDGSFVWADLTSQLSASARTSLTNGTIRSLIFMAYDKNGVHQGSASNWRGQFNVSYLKILHSA